MFYENENQKNQKLTKDYYSKICKNEFTNKENLLKSLIEGPILSLRMTKYIYNPEFKYHAIFRIRNNFQLNSMCYFD